MCTRRGPAPGDERGAVTIIVAALLPVLLVVSAFALDSLALSAGEREHQRAADAAALAAAASIPLVTLDALPLGGGTWAPGTTAGTRGCTVGDTMLDDGAATRAYRDGASQCTVTFEPDDPSLLTEVTGAIDPLLNAASVLRQLGASSAELAASLVPAVAAPRARVVTNSAIDAPLSGVTGTVVDQADVRAEAVARRRLKNAVVLPVLDADGACPVVDLLGVVTWLTGPLSGLLGSATSIGDLAGDLRQCRINANPLLDDTAADMFTRIEQTGTRLDALGLPGGPITESLVRDLRDVADPSGTAAPTQREVLEAAAERDEHVLIVLVGVTSATQIPMFDVFPVLAADLMALDPATLELDDVFALMVPTAEARGVFRASLVQ